MTLLTVYVWSVEVVGGCVGGRMSVTVGGTFSMLMSRLCWHVSPLSRLATWLLLHDGTMGAACVTTVTEWRSNICACVYYYFFFYVIRGLYYLKRSFSTVSGGHSVAFYTCLIYYTATVMRSGVK